jgi:hypothetical protein
VLGLGVALILPGPPSTAALAPARRPSWRKIRTGRSPRRTWAGPRAGHILRSKTTARAASTVDGGRLWGRIWQHHGRDGAWRFFPQEASPGAVSQSPSWGIVASNAFP